MSDESECDFDVVSSCGCGIDVHDISEHYSSEIIRLRAELRAVRIAALKDAANYILTRYPKLNPTHAEEFAKGILALKED